MDRGGELEPPRRELYGCAQHRLQKHHLDGSRFPTVVKQHRWLCCSPNLAQPWYSSTGGCAALRIWPPGWPQAPPAYAAISVPTAVRGHVEAAPARQACSASIAGFVTRAACDVGAAVEIDVAVAGGGAATGDGECTAEAAAGSPGLLPCCKGEASQDGGGAFFTAGGIRHATALEAAGFFEARDRE